MPKETPTSPTSPASAPEPYVLSAEDRQVIDALIQQQKELDISAEHFASGYLSYSATTWSRILGGQYWAMVDDPTKVLNTLRSDLRRIETARSLEARYGKQDWVDHGDAADVFTAIKQCKSKPLSNPDRLIVYLAPTGGGKSALCGRLQKQGALLVEARESWSHGYYNCVRDVAMTCRIDVDNYYQPDPLEDAVVKRLNSRRQVLAIDEGEFFCPQSLNFVKLLLNKSTVVIVLCAIPGAYDRWNTRNWHEAIQLRRRTHLLVRLGACDAVTARQFLHGITLDKPAAEAAASFARAFGCFDSLTQLRAELDGEANPTREQVIKAGNRVRVCQGLHKILEEKAN